MVKCPLKFRVDLIYSVEDIAVSNFLTFGLELLNHAHFWGVLGGFDTMNNVFVIETPKRHILGWLIRVVWGIDRRTPSTVLLQATTRKRKGRGREGKLNKVTSGLYFTYLGADPFEPISTKISTVVGVDDLIIQFNFGSDVFMDFRSIEEAEIFVSY